MAKNLKSFAPGQSGNPAGRPRGAKSSFKLLEFGGAAFTGEDLAEVIAKLFEKAKAGDLRAIEMILDRTIPKIRPAVEVFENDSLAEALEAAHARVRNMRYEDDGPDSFAG